MMDVNEREVAVMKRVLLKLCGGAALTALIIGLLLAVVLTAEPIEDVRLGEQQIRDIRWVEMERPGGEKLRLKREQSQALAELLNGLDVKRDETVQKCGTQWFAAGSRVRAKFRLWNGEEEKLVFSEGALLFWEDGRTIRFDLTKQSAYRWKTFLNDLWGDGLYDEELLCV